MKCLDPVRNSSSVRAKTAAPDASVSVHNCHAHRSVNVNATPKISQIR